MNILISYRQAPNILGWETGNLVADAFEGLGHSVTRVAKLYEHNSWLNDLKSEDILGTEFDLMLYMEMNDPDAPYTHLKYVNAKKKALWTFDVSYKGDLDRRLVDYFEFDHVFCANARYDSKWFGRPTSFLPYAACSRRHFRSLGNLADRPVDFGLVGSDRPDRRKLIGELQRAGLNAQLITGVFRDAYIDALASCKVIINQNPLEGRGLLNMRFWESMAAGSCLLTQEGDGEDSLNMSNACLVYSSMDDLIDQCRRLSSDAYQMDDIRSNGQRQVLSNNTYQHRALSILNYTYV